LLVVLFLNPKLKTPVLSICLPISTLHFTIPYEFGVATSTRVSNELGAKNPQVVRVAISVTMFLAVIKGLIISATLFGCRHILGYVYSNVLLELQDNLEFGDPNSWLSAQDHFASSLTIAASIASTPNSNLNRVIFNDSSLTNPSLQAQPKPNSNPLDSHAVQHHKHQ